VEVSDPEDLKLEGKDLGEDGGMEGTARCSGDNLWPLKSRLDSG